MKFTAFVIGGAVLVLVIIFFFAPKSSTTKVDGTMSTANATYQLDRESADLGEMAVSDVKSADFSFKNTGNDPVELSHFATSCDCTSAIVKINGKLSPEFSMGGMMSASVTNWQGQLPAGETASITVTYNPSKMPVYGAISRTATFMANSKNLTLTVKAYVK